jgi:ElaA protein
MTTELEWRVLASTELDAPTLHEVLAVRAKVFVVEQKCFYQDVDGLDLVEGTRHVLGQRAGRLAAYARVLAPAAEQAVPRIGRVLVVPELRGRDLGRAVVRRAMWVCAEQWPERPVELAAQAHLTRFYAELGFTPVGEVFDEDGIPHQWMRREPG